MVKKVKNSFCDIPTATIKSIKEAEKQANTFKIRDKISISKIVNEWDNIEINETIDKVCFTNWVDYNGYFSFIPLDDKNGNIYGIETNIIIKQNANLISEIRRQVLFGLNRIKRSQQYKGSEISKLIKQVFGEQNLNGSEIVGREREYSIKIKKKEMGNSKIVNIDEYLLSFKNSST